VQEAKAALDVMWFDMPFLNEYLAKLFTGSFVFPQRVIESIAGDVACRNKDLAQSEPARMLTRSLLTLLIILQIVQLPFRDHAVTYENLAELRACLFLFSKRLFKLLRRDIASLNE